MVTINQSIKQQPPDPSARLTLSVENLTFIRLLQKQFPISDVKAKFGKPGPGMAELSLSEEQMQTRQQV